MMLFNAVVTLASASALTIAVAAAVEGSCAQWGSRGPIKSIGRRTISISGASYVNRTVTVDIWYPAINNGEEVTQYISAIPFLKEKYEALDNPVAASPSSNHDDGFQLLVFSHGHTGVRQILASLMEHLASWGFVVVSADHVGSTNIPGIPFDPPVSLRERPKEVSLLIDTMLSSPFVEGFHLGSNVDGGVGVLGHSLGGWTGLMAAADDDRVRAVLPITTNYCFEEWDCDKLSSVTVPTLMIAAANDTSTWADLYNKQTFEETNGSPKLNLIMRGADHLSFTDLCIVFDTITSVYNEAVAYTLVAGRDYIAQAYCENLDKMQAILKYYTTAFFRTMLLLGDGGKERDAAMKCIAEQADDFDLLMRLNILQQDGLEEEDQEHEKDEKAEEEGEDKGDKEEGEGEEIKAEEDKDVIKGTPDVTGSKSEAASRLSTEEGHKEDEKNEEEEGKEEEVKAEENKDVVKDSPDEAESKSEVVSRSSAEEEDAETEEAVEAKEVAEAEEVEDGKEEEGEEEEGKAEENKDVIKDSPDEVDSKSEVVSRSSAEEEDAEAEEAAEAEESWEAEEVEEVTEAEEAEDGKEEEKEGEEEEGKAEEDNDVINSSPNVTDSKSEVASRSSAEKEEEDNNKEKEEGKEAEDDDKAEEGKDGVKEITDIPDEAESKSEVASKSSTEAEEEEDKEDEDKAEEGKDDTNGRPGVTGIKSKVTSKSSAEGEEEEDETKEGREDRGEEEEGNAAEGKDGIRGSPDVTDNKSQVALSKSLSAALSIELAALAQLLMFCVVGILWYQ